MGEGGGGTRYIIKKVKDQCYKIEMTKQYEYSNGKKNQKKNHMVKKENKYSNYQSSCGTHSIYIFRTSF